MVRIKKVFKNLISEILPQLLVMALGIVVSKVYLDFLGENAVGLNRIFIQIMAYLSIVEGGLGQAVTYRLYNPVINNDWKKISEIKNGTREIFRIIIAVMLLLGLLGGFIIPFLIKDNPYSIGYIIYNFMLYVISEVILYTTVFERSLYIASERAYKVNRIIKSSLIIKYILEIILAIFFRNLSIIFSALIVLSIIENLLVIYISKRDFKNIQKTKERDRSCIKDIKDLLIHRVAGLVANNIDVILISSFNGLATVTIYSTYFLYSNAIITLTSKLSRALLGTVGNIIEEGKEKAYATFKEYNSLIFFIVLIIAGPFEFIINYFINIFYEGKIITSIVTSVLFTCVLSYGIIRNPLTTYTEGSGLFKQTRICPIIESIVNLGISIILVHQFGMNGCLIGTVISLLVSEYFIKPRIIYKEVFQRNSKEYYKMNFAFICLLILEIAFAAIFQQFILISGLIQLLIYFALYFIANFIFIVLGFKILKQDSISKRIVQLRNSIINKEENK